MGGKNQSIFAMWLKNFTALVFTQSFQAIFMMFIIVIVNKFIVSGASEYVTSNGGIFVSSLKPENVQSTLASGTKVYAMVKLDPNGITSGKINNNTIISFVVFIGLTALIKMEKLIRGIFGIEETPLMGDLGRQMKGLFIGAKSMMDMGKRTIDPFKAQNEADSKVKKRKKIIERMNANSLPNNKNVVQNLGNGTSVNNLKSNGPTNINLEGRESLEALASSLKGLSSKGDDFYGDDSRFDNAGNLLSDRAYQEKKLLEEQQQAEVARRKKIGRLATTIASAGIAYGGTDSLTEAATVANIMDAPLDMAADKLAQSSAKKVMANRAAQKINESNENIEQIKKDFKKNLENMTSEEKQKQLSTHSLRNNSMDQIRTQKELKKVYSEVGTKLQQETDKKLSKQVVDTAKEWLKFTGESLDVMYNRPKISKETKETLSRTNKEFEDRNNRKK